MSYRSGNGFDPLAFFLWAKRRTTKCPACGTGITAKYRDGQHPDRAKRVRGIVRGFRGTTIMCKLTADDISWWVSTVPIKDFYSRSHYERLSDPSRLVYDR